MRVVYVVESMGPWPSGGVRVIVQHAEGLAARGHEVSIVTKHAAQSWLPVSVPVVEVPRFAAETLPRADVHVATWFPTVVPTVRAARAARVFHFCQGYEGTYHPGREAEVDDAYAQPIPKLLTSPHLLDVLSRFPGERHVLPPALCAEEFGRGLESRSAPRRPPVIGVVGPFQFPPKAVADALRAVARLRSAGRELRLHRVSQLPLAPEESAICRADDYLSGASAAEMAAWYRGLDALLFSATSIEGLGLPPLEAMAAGVPVVITDIPSLAFLPEHLAPRAAEGDDAGLAHELARLLDDEALWSARRAEGLARTAELTVERAVDALEHALA